MHDSKPIQDLDQLPRRLEPARDLWPEIESRLEPRDRFGERAAKVSVSRQQAPWRWSALAASLAVAFLCGLLLGRQSTPPRSAEPPQVISLNEAAAPALAAALAAVELEYASSYKGFVALQIEGAHMDPAHLQGLRDSWETMQRTEIALKAALTEHPDSQFLGARLRSLRGQQLEFMRHIHMLDPTPWRTT